MNNFNYYYNNIDQAEKTSKPLQDSENLMWQTVSTSTTAVVIKYIVQCVHDDDNIVFKSQYITGKKIILKSCETNQSVSNASAKYRVSPPILVLLFCRRRRRCRSRVSRTGWRWSAPSRCSHRY